MMYKLHIAIQTATSVHVTNKTREDDQFPWLGKDDKRRNMSDRAIMGWKVKFNNSKLTKSKK